MKKTLIVAELSANHNGSFDLAVKTIQAMARSGADAVKVQTYRPESLTLKMSTGYFAPKKEGLWKGYTPWKLYLEAAMPYEWQPKLKKIADELGLKFFSSPFDEEAVDFLEKIGVPMYKIASFEITDIPLIEHIASKGKPVIISTGLAEQKDIALAVKTCRKFIGNQITLLKCTSEYPATVEKANLLTISDMKRRFGLDVGISDHTMGATVPIAAVALGARVIEKHFTLDRELGGPDSQFSMNPQEFKEMVKAVREAEAAIGKVSYKVSEKDKKRRRSLFATRDIRSGEKLSEKNMRSIRPGYGISPRYHKELLGKKAKRGIKAGTPLSREMID